jgi:2-methylcitrate dehydratase PrpD
VIRRDFFRNSLFAGLFGLAGKGRVAPFQADFAADDPAKEPLTEYVSDFIVNTRYEDIPPELIALGKKSMLDGFGLALAGSVSDVGVKTRQYLETLVSPSGSASIIGTNLKTVPRFAAFANGVAIHADDYDDTAVIRGDAVHATVPVLPPIFALSELYKCSGRDFLLAYHIGVEVECKVSQTISPRHYGDGFHATGTMGSFGSAAACARLRRCNRLETQYALGIAGAEAGGLRANFGSMAKPFQAGHAAENGVVAADLAALGWTASKNILEAKKGYFQAAGGGFDASLLTGRLGNPWSFKTPGILIKRFPCGTIQQPVMDELLNLVQQNNIRADDIESIEVTGSKIEFDNLSHHQPKTGLEGKFSMEFCLAVVLLLGKAGLGEFVDSVVNRSDVQHLITRIKFSVDPDLEESGSRPLKIRMKSGKIFSGMTTYAKGSPQNPMSFEQVVDKFRSCAEFAKWPAQKSESVIRSVNSIERASDVSELTRALTR